MNDSQLNMPEKLQKPVANKLYKIILPMLLIIPITYVAYRYFTAPSAGYCVAQNRLIPADEFIKKKIEDEKNWRSYPEPSQLTSKDYILVDCCVVRREDGDFYSKLFRLDAGVWVFSTYEKSEKAIKIRNDKTRYGQGGVYFDSCANRLPFDKAPDYSGYPAYSEGDGTLPPVLNKHEYKNYVKWSR